VAWQYREIATAARNGLWKNRLVDWRPFWLSMLYGRYIEICYCYGRYIDILYGFWLSMVYGEQNILVYEINYKPPIVWLIYIYIYTINIHMNNFLNKSCGRLRNPESSWIRW
jgi:hypothetical protein